MDDGEIWLVLVNGLAAQTISTHTMATEADELLIQYKKRFDRESLKAANEED